MSGRVRGKLTRFLHKRQKMRRIRILAPQTQELTAFLRRKLRS
ncbi:hypothetical protein LTSEMON_2571 [Salmonella enterica subsp. enterica serovar Montevideo str. S5-403]|uniref:Uncharacterized protein n=1 Tax=Salmonella enterica subsp. enterica serovar Montevideo str. S5-403 TaxID=913242 RepID=G5Q3J2_SALMO|nr:hypothetical protein LTSEMON_2571 [Salmonella enterica subsp. enterica serovar Montevideo str. S5-403]